MFYDKQRRNSKWNQLKWNDLNWWKNRHRLIQKGGRVSLPAFFPNKYFNSNFQTTILHCISFECNALAEKRRGDDIIAPCHFSFAPYFFHVCKCRKGYRSSHYNTAQKWLIAVTVMLLQHKGWWPHQRYTIALANGMMTVLTAYYYLGLQ